MATQPGQAVLKAALAGAWRVIGSDPDAAVTQAEDILARYPGNVDGVLLLGAARRRQGNIRQARDCIRTLILQQTGAPVAWFEWGMILSETGDEIGAVEALRRAVALEPTFSGAWRMLGDQLMAVGSGVAAGEAYAFAACACVRNPQLAAAAAALTNSSPGAAVSLLEVYLRQFPGDVQATHLLAEALTRVGRIEQAETLLLHCLRLSPSFAEARHSLGILRYAQHRFGEAVPHFKQLLNLMPQQPSLRSMLAIAMVETGDYEGALPLYEAMLAVFHEQPKVWLGYAHALKILGRETEAARAYRICIGLGPNWASGAYLSLADMKTEPFTEAELDTMRRRLADTKNDPIEGAQLHYALGRALEYRGSYKDAFGHFAQGGRASEVFNPIRCRRDDRFRQGGYVHIHACFLRPTISSRIEGAAPNFYCRPAKIGIDPRRADTR